MLADPYRIPAGPMPAPSSWRDRPAGRLLDLCVVAWLFLATSAVLPLLFTTPGSTGIDPQAREALRLLGLPSVALAPLLLLLHPRAVLAAFVRHPALALLLAWVWGSVLWSLDPGISARRAMALTSYTLIACWLVAAYEPAALLRRLAWLMLVVLLLSLAFAAALPKLAFMPDSGQLRGVFTHKNVLGQQLVIAAILLPLAWQARLIPRAAAALGLLLVAAFAVPTGSATSLVILLLLLGLKPLVSLFGLPRGAATAGLLLLVTLGAILALAAILALEPLLGLLGRDLTFTGRTGLWSYVASMIAHRPLLGYGYNIFFDLPSVAQYLQAALRWEIPNAHNGYLETWLGLGLPGVLLVTGFLVAGLLRSLPGLAGTAPLAARFAFLFLAVYLVRNLVESDLMSQTQLSWVLAVVAVLLADRPACDKPETRR
jgi:exopolysaccharide production protein ExoQ